MIVRDWTSTPEEREDLPRWARGHAEYMTVILYNQGAVRYWNGHETILTVANGEHGDGSIYLRTLDSNGREQDTPLVSRMGDVQPLLHAIDLVKDILIRQTDW